MDNYDGFRLIGVQQGIASGMLMVHGVVSYQPDVKYRIEKKNAFNPSIIIRRGRYHEDTIECQAIIDSEKYDELLNFLNSSELLYIEFSSKNKKYQLPVYVHKFPRLEDEARSFKDAFKFSLRSVYEDGSAIDFDNIFGYGNSYGNNYGF